MVKILLLLVVAVNGLYAVRFFTDFLKHKEEAWKEPGNNVFLAIWGAVCFFFSTFGISDFALSMALEMLSERPISKSANSAASDSTV